MQEMWQYPIGTVVRFIPTEDQHRALWGHVFGFSTTGLGQVALVVDWQESDVCECVVLPSEVEVQP